MRTIAFILRKEFVQIFRHRVMLPLIFLMPIIQLLILANAASYEVYNITLHVVDKDLSAASRRLTNKISGIALFLTWSTPPFPLRRLLKIWRPTAPIFSWKFRVILNGISHKDREASVNLTINAINGMKAGIANGYANAIIQDFAGNIRSEWMGIPAGSLSLPLSVTYSNWFNPELNYYTFMVPGILVMLVTLVGMFLAGMNIVKEKEIGTIEQINVTPIRKYQFIIGKLLPFWIIGNVELALGLFIGVLVFSIPIEGSLLLVFAFATVYLLVVLGLGLFISTFTETQQQAMFISWFLLVIFILMSGLFTPIESMPGWAQKMTLFNPIAYFVDVMRLVLLKGSGFWEIKRHFVSLGVFALVINTLAVINYRKTN